MKTFLLRLASASVVSVAVAGAMAQTPPSVTPTTAILAIGTFPAGTDMQLVRRILPGEVRETANLYLNGKIQQWYSLQDRPGVVLVLNTTDVELARAMLEQLPLGRSHLMTFQLLPVGPLNPLRELVTPPGPR